MNDSENLDDGVAQAIGHDVGSPRYDEFAGTTAPARPALLREIHETVDSAQHYFDLIVRCRRAIF